MTSAERNMRRNFRSKIKRHIPSEFRFLTRREKREQQRVRNRAMQKRFKHEYVRRLEVTG